MEKRFSHRCKCCDGKKKEETNVRMMKTLYPGETATDTMIGCYMTWESAIR